MEGSLVIEDKACVACVSATAALGGVLGPMDKRAASTGWTRQGDARGYVMVASPPLPVSLPGVVGGVIGLGLMSSVGAMAGLEGRCWTGGRLSSCGPGVPVGGSGQGWVWWMGAPLVNGGPGGAWKIAQGNGSWKGEAVDNLGQCSQWEHRGVGVGAQPSALSVG